MVEEFVPLLGAEFKLKYYYFDEWTKADQFYRDPMYALRAKPRLVTCFDIIQNPGEMR